MENSNIILGIDLGNTIHHKDENGERVPMPDSFQIIKELVGKVKKVYIVSRVDEEQKRRAKIWFEKHNFFQETGLTPEQVFFCEERPEKGPICKTLGVTHFIDDRVEVMLHMPDNVVKILMKPRPSEFVNLSVYAVQKINEATIVNNWKDIQTLFL